MSAARASAWAWTQIRQELNTAQFDQAFSAGFGLTQRQAVEIARDQHGTSPQRF